MKMDRFRFLSIVLISLLAMGNLLSAQEINEKVWSISYWQKLAEKGLVEIAKETTVPDAIYTGSKINAKTVLIDDSPDVPVINATNVTQSENSIFVNPLDNNKVLNSNNSTTWPVSTLYGSSGFFTTDAGLTWGGSPQGTGGSNSGDPAAVIDLNGHYYVGYITNSFGMGVARSTNEGQTWTAATVHASTNDDKNHLWADNSPSSPYAGHIYDAWTDFNNDDIAFSRSTDGGVSWSAPLNVSSAVASGSHDQGCNIQTGPNGEVYVAWAIYDAFPADENAIGFAKSTDGGLTFAPATRIISNIRGLRNTETSKNHRVAAFPSMAVDISGGPRNGWIYMVWPNIGVPGINTGPDIDVYMIRSTNGGQNWSMPIRVNQDPPGLGKEHYHCWITCDPETGALSVIFYDDRNVSSTQCEVFVANSLDGGDTWEDFKVSDVAFTPAPIAGLASGYMGDYLGISARGGRVYPVWTDNRTGNALAYVSPFTLADPEDPNPPSALEAYSDYTTPTSMALTWSNPTNLTNGDTLLSSDFQIHILRDDVPLDSVPGGTEQYMDTGLSDGVLYIYTLFTKILANDSVSFGVNASWTAGGNPVPERPTAFSLTNAGGGQLMAHWMNPSDNIDGTPMDDFDAINLYEDGSLLTTFTRSPSDTGTADSALFTPGGANLPYYATAVDNESPANESDASNTAYPPFIAPYSQDFESGTIGTPGTLPVQWTNESDDDHDWYVDAGGTPSLSTGPTVDHTLGTGAGKYMFIESSSPFFNMTAHLTSPFIDPSTVNNPGMAFWYHMYGQTMGDLHVDVYANGVWNLDVMPPLIGQQQQNQTDPWLQAVVDLSTYAGGPIQIRFRGITGSDFYSDMAIDDVFFGSLNDNPQMTVSPQILSDTLLVGATKMRTVTVSNAAILPTTMNYSVTEDPAVGWLSVSPTSGTLTSGQSDDLTVTLDASVVTAGTYNTELIVSGTDTTNVQDTVAVTLVVNDAPAIRVEPDTVEMQVEAGAVDSTIFTIHNDGSGPLQIFSIEDEEINARGHRRLLYHQEQRPVVSYPKGEEPVSNGGQQTDGSGGPDPFGYKWIDSDEPGGPPYVFTDISGTGTVVTLVATGTFDPKDEGMATINMPFSVNFYGNSYNTLQVNSNGAVIFDLSFFANMYTNVTIPSIADPQLLVCPLWDDLDGSAGGDIYYEQVGNRFIIQWHNWGYYPAGTENMIFQVVFFQNSSTIWFVYENMTDRGSATFGIENIDGTVGLEIAYNQTYAHNQLLTKITLGAEWLTQTPTGGTVGAGDSLEVTLKADATMLSQGSYRARVLIASNDPVNATLDEPVVELQVGEGAPAISVSPTSLDFDSTYVGEDSTMSIMVENLGTDTLEVNNILATNAAFSVDTTNFIVLPSAMQQVAVTFSPLTPGTYSGLIRIVSNDPANDTLNVAVSGYGEPPVGIENTSALPKTFSVSPNYPNPFNPTTTFSYQLPEVADVKLFVYNILGQKVRTLINQRVEPGYHTFEWNGLNDSGKQVATGLYIYRFEAGNYVRTMKMMMLK